MRFKQNPYHLLLFGALALVFASIFSRSKNTVDIHIYDTYYIIGQTQILWAMTSILGALWLLYVLTKKLLYAKWVTWLHVSVSLLSMLILLLLLLKGHTPIKKPGTSPVYIDWTAFDDYNKHMKRITYCVIFFLVGQFAFVTNLVVGSIGKQR